MKILGILAILFLFVQCHENTDRTYVLENKTSYDIKVESFENKKLAESYLLKPNAVFSYYYTSYGSAQAYKALAGDSIIVTFDNKKRLIFTNQFVPATRNIMNNVSYVAESNVLYMFTFTEEDYNNAVSF